MPKPSPNKTQLATMIDKDVHEALRTLAEDTDVSIARIVEDAVRYTLHMHGRNPEPAPEAEATPRVAYLIPRADKAAGPTSRANRKGAK
jgi:hypothetical protein